MFLESEIDNLLNFGSIEVICGSMFSGKTEELIRRVNKAKFAKLKTIVFKPKIDTRHEEKKVVTHNSNTVESVAVKSAREMLKFIQDFDVFAIDEAQFFTIEILDVCKTIANNNKRVILAGLDMDFQGNPFGIMPQLLAIAEHVTKVHAVCGDCGKMANHSFRFSKNKELIEIGQKNEYKPLCRSCFKKNIE